jgi:hypothetical protein
MQLRALFSIAMISLVTARATQAAGWEETIPPYAPGSFTEPRAVKLEYTFGWNGINSAGAELHFHRANDQFVLDGSAHTTGLARKLWKYDVQHTSTTDAHTLRPVHVQETENDRAKHIENDLTFTPERVAIKRVEQKNDKTKSNEKTFDFPNVMSLNSALLYFRSKPLVDGNVERVVVFPQSSPYVCTVTVLGHEPVTVPAGTHNAIKLEMKLDKIKDHELKPHKKFKQAFIWLSNDPDRLILRIEAHVFLGTVFAELQSAQFEGAKP